MQSINIWPTSNCTYMDFEFYHDTLWYYCDNNTNADENTITSLLGMVGIICMPVTARHNIHGTTNKCCF